MTPSRLCCVTQRSFARRSVAISRRYRRDMATVAESTRADQPNPRDAPRSNLRSRWPAVAVAAIIALVAARPLYASHVGAPALRAWATIFIAVCIQAMPFLVLGVAVSGAIAAFATPELFARLLPRSPLAAVPIASLAGAVLPGCECGSVPIAGRLVRRGVPPAAALTFLLSAPAINPVVLVATATAFPGQPKMVVARALGSILASVVVGYLWAWRGDDSWMERLQSDHAHADQSRLRALAVTMQNDFLQAGGFLVLGAAAAATLHTAVPRSVLDVVASHRFLSVLALGLLAVLLAICSEADAFIAAGLNQFSLTSRLAFLVVGPMVDVKLIALQVGTFGRRFAYRFAPVTFVAAVGSAWLVGTVMLG
jgi:uncharacterized protein